MTTIVAIASEIQEIEAQVARVERLVAEHPKHPSLLITHDSLLKRQQNLQEAFAQEAAANFIDVCSYAILPNNSNRYPLLALSNILADFQELVTIAFDAIRSKKPKLRARPSAENTQLSSFDFGYATSGSLRIALTIPNERLLVGGSDLDIAVEAIFELMKVSDSEAVSKFSETIGVAAIKKLYELADVHREYGLDADVSWGRSDAVRAHALVQSPEFDRLCTIIDQKSDEQVEPLQLEGRLVGLDVELGTFHMTFPKGDDISGRLAESFVREAGIEIPGVYNVEMSKKTVIYYSTRQDKITYELRRLSQTSLLGSAN